MHLSTTNITVKELFKSLNDHILCVNVFLDGAGAITRQISGVAWV